jgi:signal transduction histidine kinase
VKYHGFGRHPTTGETARELQAARDIAHAFLNATTPAEVYHLALARVTPLVDAAFACVFLRDGTGDLLHVVAAHNWPEEYQQYLSEMRVRIGLGPTGRAVAGNRVVEVYDVFADEGVADWWEAARELGFASSTSLPLVFGSEAVGAVTFYFREPESLSDADRSLLQLVANQLAAAAEKAHLIDDLQRANALLRRQNEELEIRYREAEEAKRLKSEFLANVSHELRTPLTAILGYTYLLREGLSGELQGEQASSVARIETAASALMRLINDLLDLTHLKLGRISVETQPCDAVALTHTAIAGVQAGAGVELRTEMAHEALPIKTDPIHLLRILSNLVSNAFKFTTRGSVTVRLRREAADGDGSGASAAAVVWEVEDTGIGIAPEDQERIFDEFRQVDGSSTRRFGGTGLGLALSRGLAHRLGGTIDVRSRLGEGATFTLRLPAADGALATDAATDTLHDDQPQDSR